MKTFIFNRWVEDIFRGKTLREEETQGYLVCIKGKFTPNGVDEGVVPVETGIGPAGHVTKNEKIYNALQKVVQGSKILDTLEYNIHSSDTLKLDPKWAYSLSNFGEFGDMPLIREEIRKDPDYQHLFVTPECYVYVYANPASSSGLSGKKYVWGTAPLLTSFDWRFDRKALADAITKDINEALK